MDITESQEIPLDKSYTLLDSHSPIQTGYADLGLSKQIDNLSVRMSNISEIPIVKRSNVDFTVIDDIEHKLDSISRLINESCENLQQCFYQKGED